MPIKRPTYKVRADAKSGHRFFWNSFSGDAFDAHKQHLNGPRPPGFPNGGGEEQYAVTSIVPGKICLRRKYSWNLWPLFASARTLYVEERNAAVFAPLKGITTKDAKDTKNRCD